MKENNPKENTENPENPESPENTENPDNPESQRLLDKMQERIKKVLPNAKSQVKTKRNHHNHISKRAMLNQMVELPETNLNLQEVEDPKANRDLLTNRDQKPQDLRLMLKIATISLPFD